MQDIYNRTVEYGDAFAADKMVITFANFGAGLLVQGLQLTYAQQLTRIWELGSKKTYFVGGRTAGTLSVSQLAAPTDLATAFLQQYGDVCNAQSNVLKVAYAGGWCRGSANGGYTLNNVVLNNLAMQVDVTTMLLSENLSGLFNALTRG